MCPWRNSTLCHPIRSLEGITQRAAGQLYQGRQTHIGWTAKEIVLPTIEGSAASGAIIRVAGITGRIRGMKFKRADGQSIRPSLVLIDQLLAAGVKVRVTDPVAMAGVRSEVGDKVEYFKNKYDAVAGAAALLAGHDAINAPPNAAALDEAPRVLDLGQLRHF